MKPICTGIIRSGVGAFSAVTARLVYADTGNRTIAYRHRDGTWHRYADMESPIDADQQNAIDRYCKVQP